MESRETFPPKKKEEEERREMLILWKVETVSLHSRKLRNIHAMVEDGERFFPSKRGENRLIL